MCDSNVLHAPIMTIEIMLEQSTVSGRGLIYLG